MNKRISRYIGWFYVFGSPLAVIALAEPFYHFCWGKYSLKACALILQERGAQGRVLGIDECARLSDKMQTYSDVVFYLFIVAFLVIVCVFHMSIVVVRNLKTADSQKEDSRNKGK